MMLNIYTSYGGHRICDMVIIILKYDGEYVSSYEDYVEQ